MSESSPSIALRFVVRLARIGKPAYTSEQLLQIANLIGTKVTGEVLEEWIRKLDSFDTQEKP